VKNGVDENVIKIIHTRANEIFTQFVITQFAFTIMIEMILICSIYYNEQADFNFQAALDHDSFLKPIRTYYCLNILKFPSWTGS